MSRIWSLGCSAMKLLYFWIAFNIMKLIILFCQLDSFLKDGTFFKFLICSSQSAPIVATWGSYHCCWFLFSQLGSCFYYNCWLRTVRPTKQRETDWGGQHDHAHAPLLWAAVDTYSSGGSLLAARIVAVAAADLLVVRGCLALMQIA